MANKELRGCGIIVLRARHRDDTTSVLQRVFDSVCRKFTHDFFIRSTRAVSLGISAQNHKVFDDTVEDQAVIKVFGNKLFEVFYCNRGNVGE